MKKLKRLLAAVVTGAAAATSLLMVAVGYSDRLSPEHWPALANVGMLFPMFVAANVLMLLVVLAVKWRRAWVPLAGFVLALEPLGTYLPLHLQTTAPDDCLRVVSYNVCGFSGNGRYDPGIDSIAAYLERLQPDIVCLQEDMGGKGQPMERLRQMFAYNDTVHVNATKNCVNAVGIHTRFPIVRTERISYQSETNGSVAFWLLVDGDTVVVVNNHLEHSHLSTRDRQRYKKVLKGEMDRQEAGHEAHLIMGKLNEGTLRRAPQADSVHAYIERHRQQYAMIVCGDFNDTPVSYARHTVALGLTDCYAATGCGLGLSYNQKGFNLRIDHLFCSSRFRPYGCEVDSKMDASDHYPVVCWLKKVDNS